MRLKFLNIKYFSQITDKYRSQTEEEEDYLGAADKMRLIVAEMILEQLTGEKVELKISMLRLGKNAMDTL